jgi:DegV family protein with EDD domain
MIKIVVDSTCDLPAELYHRYGISVVPINIQFGTETYLDGIDIDRALFYSKIEELGVLPSTSQPSAGQFQRVYLSLAGQGASDIISIHVTAKLSGTCQSAQMAQELVADRVRVHPFDSAGGSAGLGFMALEAARLVGRGAGVAEILTRLEAIRPRIELLFTLNELRFAQLSGRVGRLQGTLSSLLDIKPVIRLEDGLIDVTEKVRTRQRALNRILDIMVERLGTDAPVNLAVVHGDAPEAGEELMRRATSVLNCRDAFITNLTTTLLVHFGPGTVGLIGYRI